MTRGDVASGGPSVLAAAIAGTCVPVGWGCHDLAVYATSADPRSALLLVPRLILAACLGAAIGVGLVHLRWLRWTLPLAASIVAARPGAFGFVGSSATLELPRAFAFALAAGMLAWVVTRKRSLVDVAAVAFATGVAACAARLALRDVQVDGLVPAVAGAAALLLVAGLFGRARPWVWVAAAALVAVPVGIDASARIALPRPDLAPPTVAAGPDATSVLLVVLDTVRADRTSAYGYERDTTPNLDRFARREATRFDAARSTSSWTLPSHASLLTGRLPGEHGVTHPRRSGHGRPGTLAPDATTLAERLRALGYRTGAIVANHMMGSWAGLDVGFERYDDRGSAYVRRYLPLAQAGRGTELVGHKPYRDARAIGEAALAWLDGLAGAPFFLMLNYMDAHGPYVPPPPFDRAFDAAQPSNRMQPRELELFPLLYDRELAYLDAELGRLFGELRARGSFEDTLVVVTSDHGEAFGEHGTWIHDWTLYDELVRVPLLVKPAGGRREAIDSTPISGAQVHDLILAEVGLEVDRETSERPFGEWYFTDRLKHRPELPSLPIADLSRDLLGWFDGRRKVLVGSDGTVEVFDIATDPAERHPVVLTPEERELARTRARDWWAAHPPPDCDSGRTVEVALDDETVECLRGLGYVGIE